MKKIVLWLQQFAAFLRKNAGYGAVFLRIVFGVHLIYYTMVNGLGYEKIIEFSHFLEDKHIPYPLFNAFLSIGVQFICGILLILGAGVRVLSALLLVNFMVAILMAHAGDPYSHYFPALHMIAISLFFLFNGAGPLSVDYLLSGRKKRHQRP